MSLKTSIQTKLESDKVNLAYDKIKFNQGSLSAAVHPFSNLQNPQYK